MKEQRENRPIKYRVAQRGVKRKDQPNVRGDRPNDERDSLEQNDLGLSDYEIRDRDRMQRTLILNREF